MIVPGCLRIFGALSLTLFLLTASAQQGIWKGKRAAIVLTYDDALPQHLDIALPQLSRYGFAATFYLNGAAPAVAARVGEWQAAAKTGHELGNHSLFHPCAGNLPGREWVAADYDLSTYSLQRITDELRTCNLLLQTMDGKKRRSYAYTCADKIVGANGQPFMPGMQSEFSAARSVRNTLAFLPSADLYDLPAYLVDRQSAAQLKQWVDEAISREGLLILLFHGVGGGHNINVEAAVHDELLQYIKQQEKQLWVAPLTVVADYIRDHGSGL